MENQDSIAVNEAWIELVEARRKFPRFNSAHEGFAVLWEEVDELWDEVKQRSKSEIRMRDEAIQVAAMALRFAADICPVVGGDE